jgi:PKHD-type hydroxylase
MIHPIPPRNIIGKDYVAYWEDFLSDQEINRILTAPEWDTLENAVVGGQDDKSVLNTDIRTSEVAWMRKNAWNEPLWERLSTVVAEVNRRYFHFDLSGFYEPFQLGMYREENQGHYSWHTDMAMSDNNVPRKLSMSLLLSDPSEFEGGNLEIKGINDEPMNLELRKGRAWFFPSWVLHRVSPVTRGVRKSLVVWVGGPPFK